MTTAAPERELLELAREAIRARLEGRAPHPPELPPPWDRPRGVFVTLHDRQGRLRGCIGHVEPAGRTLAEGVAMAAAAAAFDDPRFPPVTAGELDDLDIEISILGPLEPVSGPAELDPARYGVLVERAGRRGVLLPRVEGVATPEQQLAIACAKGGFESAGAERIWRFSTETIRKEAA